MKYSIILIAMMLFLAGCGENTYDKAMKQAYAALQNEEFDKAAASFELALDENPGDQEASKAYEQLTLFKEVKEANDEKDWDVSIEKADQLLKKTDLLPSLKQELEKYKKTAIDNKEKQSTLHDQLAEIEALINKQNYTEAEKQLKQLKEGKSLENEQQKVNELSDSVKDALQNKAKEETVQPKEKETEGPSKKNEYLQKLAKVESSFGDLDHLYESGTTYELKEAEGEVYKRWDNLLNEIYGELKKQLPASEMNELRNEQREWIKNRDKQADEASANFEGGTFAGVQYLSSLGQITRERCYELVNNYIR
ncbi:lysozyme inhibitor LprI family protein [Metabacillus fastidiosus]|uniref:lysozyme inhibitor LprI family protein n=1 Tax=Metabacillus fastidiosus TaxID=1458 RepID=UPI002DBC99A2|nr:lysozyme inhibitor LprI family protein [Metabacillus fastidiosus]MEC2074482.1 lysozyme inhibitor LprI family protein [Metabacillus fastidiosus]